MGEEISLRKAERGLVHAYYRGFVRDPDIFMDMERFAAYRYDPGEVDRLFDARMAAPDRREFLIMLGEAPVGEICLKRIDMARGECTLSVHMQNDAVKNRGYGTRAELLALRYAFEELGVSRVLADTVRKNARSRHVLEKLGFTCTGRDETFLYYQYTRETYEKKLKTQKT